MGRYLGPVCKISRRDSMPLLLKGSKCAVVKSNIVKKRKFGSTSGRGNRKLSDYAIELREKQKLKILYGGLRERQFYNIFKKAESKKGKTGDLLLEMLESRFDNILVRCRFAISYYQARQFISHSHFLVNDKRMNIPSHFLKAGDIIKLKINSKITALLRSNLKDLSRRKEPEWLEVDQNKIECTILTLPKKSEIVSSVDEQLIVEFYSK